MIIVQILARVLAYLLSLFETVLIVRAILSWIPPARTSRFYEFLMRITEPIIHPIRKLLFCVEWIRTFPLDLSTLVVFILISMAQSLLYYFF